MTPGPRYPQYRVNITKQHAGSSDTAFPSFVMQSVDNTHDKDEWLFFPPELFFFLVSFFHLHFQNQRKKKERKNFQCF